ncbi:hypothetical protein, variant 3 [Aphanomyces invadans]|uniref:Uncharacterized protein n=1 Tax=Aphanomyces invadans TaxID=157072 RepID=A0A024TFG6_9STRA|nr:hypothetical protein, variant 3 [Aphanomyces invadans]XP_008878553.1 hypothetical protein, variant 1 [Aphanomyces invadans]XP_008878554.1 hypothetical protein, variant 2 [Aphanomyces invadans]XP_008878555.1 hypothetical protein H310_13006 [Aphanomyces invadans]ETV92782.1 hypothetical protein H310_13006 [Aphanomyces invadans]ETV92783.1 hypothetical protein, variant 1 [Aphanomyces invadans]ETV92784.1 hypothetical protein, variant 2 [Aphanomyces invadans]ETV92785.1 hypothetical protein, vari|eukprot:XP_008878552.1 hypothetical protein, variant 3 [Aphanomyces invadans]
MTDAAAGTDAAWGYYDLHSTPTASPYLRHQRRSYSTSPHQPHPDAKVASCAPLPLRTIRRVTCLQQLGGMSTAHSSLSSNNVAGVTNALTVPPLPKHSPTIHKWVSLPPPPTPTTPHVNRTSAGAIPDSAPPHELMVKTGILRQSGRTVVVSLQDHHLAWQAVDSAFQPLKGTTKHILVVAPLLTTVQAFQKHWTITTNNTVLRFDCPAAGSCAAWVRTLRRVLNNATPPLDHPLVRHMPPMVAWTGPPPRASAMSSNWASAPIRITAMHPSHPPPQAPFLGHAAHDGSIAALP